MPRKKIVTLAMLGEGYAEFDNGVVIRRSFEGVVKLPDGNYAVDDPNDKPAPPPREWDRMPVVDARSHNIQG